MPSVNHAQAELVAGSLPDRPGGMLAKRDHQFESAFLEDATGRPGSPFIAAVLARVDRQDNELGASFLYATLSSLLAECKEESEDLAAWGMLAVEAATKRDGIADRDLERLRALLERATRHAAEAFELLELAEKAIRA